VVPYDGLSATAELQFFWAWMFARTLDVLPGIKPGREIVLTCAFWWTAPRIKHR
jgi:hypothetical protein